MLKRHLLELVPQSKKFIFEAVILKLLSLISQVFIVYATINILKSILEFKSLNIINEIIIFAFALIVRIISEKLTVKISYLSSKEVKFTLRDLIFDKLTSLKSVYLNDMSTAEIVQLSTEGVEQLQIYFGQYLPQLFYSFLAPLTLFAVVSKISLKVAIVLLATVPLIPISIMLVQNFAKKLLGKYWKSYTSLGDSFLSNLEGLTTLKIYKADEHMSDKMDKDAENFRKITMRVLVMQLNSISVMDIVALGGAAIGMIVAVNECIKGNISIYETLAIILLSAEFFIPMRQLGSLFHIAMNGIAASDKIFKFLDIKVDQYGKESIDARDIKVNNLFFSYDDSRTILNDINFSIGKNAFVSFVGESGSGKSTIAGILSGKFRNYTGNIIIGSKNFKDIKHSDIIKNMTVVENDSFIFKGTIRDNLIMSGDFSDKEMEEALLKVNLLNSLKSRGGLDAEVLEGGKNLSGGERQRLAIARAILKDTPIYIFDEATSNIDPESEEIIMNIIYKMSKTKSIIFISHKLSNVVNSDMIYFLKNGKLTEKGSHNELINLNKDYKKLYEYQRSLLSYQKEVNYEK